MPPCEGVIQNGRTSDAQPVRRHGCQLPFHCLQVLAWLVWLLLVSGCFAFYIPLVQTLTARIVVAAVYSSILLTIAACYLVTCLTDSSDPGIDGVAGGDDFCDTCQAWTHKRSRHCNECNRCVSVFDHHCKWVNNCIGSKNYRPFISMLSSTVTMMAVQLAVGVYLFARCFYSPEDTKADLAAAYHFTVVYQGYAAALGVYSVAVAAALWPLMELLLLHMVLHAKDMTTFEFIMANKDRVFIPSTTEIVGEHIRERTKQLFSSRSRRVSDSSVAASPALAQQHALGQQLQQPGAKKKKKKVPLSACLAWRTQQRPDAAQPSPPAGKQQEERQGDFDAALDAVKPSQSQQAVAITVHAGSFEPSLIFSHSTHTPTTTPVGDEAA